MPSRYKRTFLLLLFAAATPCGTLMTGCGSGSSGEPQASKSNQPSPSSQSADQQANKSNEGSDQSNELPDTSIQLSNQTKNKDDKAAETNAAGEPDTGVKQAGVKQAGVKQAGAEVVSAKLNPPNNHAQVQDPHKPDLVKIDEDLIAAQGIKKIEGKFLTVYTDLRDSEDIAQFPATFEQAIPQWCQYFSIDEADAATWHMTAFVIANKNAFVKARLLTDQLPSFASGYQSGRQMWIFRQEGNYYTRHLLLHEGTHGFMERFLRGYGPPWYAEGMAELLAVHRWQNEKLTLNYRLRDRSEAENWGRVRIIQDAYKNGQALSLEQAMLFDSKDFFHASRPYAWSWAACYFLSQHPLSQKDFTNLQSNVNVSTAQFTTEFVKALGDRWSQLSKEWQLFVDEMEYGYDVTAAAIKDVKMSVDTVHHVRRVSLDTRRGWQRTDLNVVAGQAYIIRTSGDFQIANREVGGKMETWTSRPNGITIEYHHGRPLGVVVAAVDSVDKNGQTDLLKVQIAHEIRWVPKTSGKLCLRVNDSPARLDDNQGQVQFELRMGGPGSSSKK